MPAVEAIRESRNNLFASGRQSFTVRQGMGSTLHFTSASMRTLIAFIFISSAVGHAAAPPNDAFANATEFVLSPATPDSSNGLSATKTSISSSRARSCGSSFSSQAGVSNAEITGNRLASRRRTTLMFAATSTPAFSCSSTRLSVRYQASSGASRDSTILMCSFATRGVKRTESMEKSAKPEIRRQGHAPLGACNIFRQLESFHPNAPTHISTWPGTNQGTCSGHVTIVLELLLIRRPGFSTTRNSESANKPIHLLHCWHPWVTEDESLSAQWLEKRQCWRLIKIA